VLVEEPQGWLPDRGAGSVSYAAEDVAQLATGVVLVYVGRFTAVKRLDLLIGAFAQARQRVSTPAGLVLVGGHPGEWEGEHPAELASSVGASAVFLAGWRSHEDLPSFFSASDAVVLASAREQFGQVLIEGMACELPAIATRSLGPASIIEDGETGWLVDPEERALADALVEAVDDREERERRGRAAASVMRERFSWPAISERLASVLEQAVCKARDAPVRGSAHGT
jgi:glycosyltransferase involved in cell wall biosynthesis